MGVVAVDSWMADDAFVLLILRPEGRPLQEQSIILLHWAGARTHWVHKVNAAATYIPVDP